LTRVLGLAAVATALGLAVYGTIAAAAGAARARPKLVRSARSAAYSNFVLLAIANLAMVYALVTHDFSVGYVAQVGSRSTPLFFTIISLWSSLEGSILFWGLVLAGYTAIAAFVTRERLGALGSYALATMLGVSVFFFLLLVGPANPFGRVWPVPLDGPGPNPLLQNHLLMAVHPPLLYFGYVGMTVPFAFAIGALLAGRLDDTWIRETRRWTITSWTFLSLAIMFGMWWSYEVLGWGGYWAWDPVENASFMPWLTATAFLHSVMVQERRDMLKVWNLSLIIATFLLTILGTFLTRSGVISSVHAFSEGPIGVYFLGFIGVILLFSLTVLAGRSKELGSAGRLDHPVSRETVFLFNNLLFTAFTFTVLLGTLFPLVAEAVRGVKVSVGAPFFNRMTVPICAALLFLVGVGPVLPWRGVPPGELKRRFAAPLVGMVAMTAIAILAGTRSVYAILAFAFAGFALVGNLSEFVTGSRARMRSRGESALVAVRRLFVANNRRYGGYIAHIGVIVMAVGITASSTFRNEREATMRPGQMVEVGDYGVRFDELWAQDEPQRFVIGADLTVFKGDREVGKLDPRLNRYKVRDEPVPTPAVRTTIAGDLYINLLAFENDGSSATFTLIIEPLVAWIWVGGVIVALGATLGVLPLGGRDRQTRVPARREEEMVTV